MRTKFRCWGSRGSYFPGRRRRGRGGRGALGALLGGGARRCVATGSSPEPSGGRFPPRRDCLQNGLQTQFWDATSPRSWSPAEGANFSAVPFWLPTNPSVPPRASLERQPRGQHGANSQEEGNRLSSVGGRPGPRWSPVEPPWRGSGLEPSSRLASPSTSSPAGCCRPVPGEPGPSRALGQRRSGEGSDEGGGARRVACKVSQNPSAAGSGWRGRASLRFSRWRLLLSL